MKSQHANLDDEQGQEGDNQEKDVDNNQVYVEDVVNFQDNTDDEHDHQNIFAVTMTQREAIPEKRTIYQDSQNYYAILNE